MSHHSKQIYHNPELTGPDSESEDQALSTTHSLSTPPSPSSAGSSSDPVILVKPISTSQINHSKDSDLVFPSTSVEFNLTRPQHNPTTLPPKSLGKGDYTITALPTTTQPVFTPPLRPNTKPIMPSSTGVNALPIQGKRDAPRTFKGSYDKVEEFLKTMEKLFARFEVTSESEKVEAILPYCSTKVQDFIRTTSGFTKPNWVTLRKDMMEYYDAERATRKYNPNDIWSFNKQWNHKSITNLTQWKKYY